MEIVKLTQGLENLYEDFLHTIPESTLYYSLKYRNFLCKILNCQPEYWLVLENSVIKAVLPLMIKETSEYGKVINSLPYYGSNGGVLASCKEAYQLLCQHYNKLVSQKDIAASTIVCNPLKHPSREDILYDVIDYRIGQFIRLPERKNLNFDQMLSTFEGSTRRNIKKAINSSISVNIDNTAFDYLRECHNENMKAINGKAKSDLFFSLIPQSFVSGKDFNIYVAKNDDNLIAALLLFYYNKTIEYYTPVISLEHRTKQPLALIVYQAIKDGAQKGFLWWNWGGTWLNQDGVYKFKKKWGTLDYPYEYYIKINNKDLLNLEKIELLNIYNDFFVLPFNLLKKD